MKLLKSFCLVFLVITNIYASKESIKTGLLYDRIFTTKKEAIIGSKLWLKQMEDSNYKNKMDISFYDDPKKMIKDFKDKKIEVMVCDAISYFEDKDLINSLSSKAWILSRIDSMFEQYYLVKNRKSKLTLKNLSPKNIYYKSDLSKIWLDTILHRDSIKLKNSSFIKLEKPKKMIFNIFFNEVDIAIIPKDLYDSMLDLNPQVAKKLEIIKKSKDIFFTGIGFTRKNINPEFNETLEVITSDVNDIKRDMESISFINIQHVYPVAQSELSELDKLYKEYKNFKKRKKLKK